MGFSSNIAGSTTDAGGPLTEQDWDRAVEGFEKRSDWEYLHPHGVSAENPHIVSASAKRHGGWTRCTSCGAPVEVSPDA